MIGKKQLERKKLFYVIKKEKKWDWGKSKYKLRKQNGMLSVISCC